MDYKVTDIIKDVRVIMDNNKEDKELISVADIDTLNFDELIQSKICEATRFVIKNADAHLLGSGKLADKENLKIVWRNSVGYGSGRFILPSDFLRLVSFQMSDWSYPVAEYITEKSPLYSRQFSAYAGIRGNPNRPIVAVVNGEKGLSLEFFACTEGPTVMIKQFAYVANPEIKTKTTSPDTSAPETSPDTSPDTSAPETSPETSPDTSAPETSPETSPDTSAPETSPETSPDTSAPETSPETSPDTSAPETSPETSPDTSAPETSPETSPDTSAPELIIEIPELLYNAVTYYVAYLVASSLELNIANFLFTTSKTYLE